MAEVKSVFLKWEAREENLGKEPKFEAYRKWHEKRNAKVMDLEMNLSKIMCKKAVTQSLKTKSKNRR